MVQQLVNHVYSISGCGQSPYPETPGCSCSDRVQLYKRLLWSLSLTLLCALCGVVALVLVLVLVQPSTPTSDPSPSCQDLLEPQVIKSNKDAIFSGNWTLNEAYSTDSIDVYALKHANNSWAKFNVAKDETIGLKMGHRLHNYRNKTEMCVYHDFQKMKLSDNTLYLSLPHYNSSATIHSLKTCRECLVLQLNASVPTYPPLTYLLVYARNGLMPHDALMQTRKQAECLKFETPPPFQYNGAGLFCSQDINDATSASDTSTRKLLISSLFQW